MCRVPRLQRLVNVGGASKYHGLGILDYQNDANANLGRLGREFATPYVPRQGKDPHGGALYLSVITLYPIRLKN